MDLHYQRDGRAAMAFFGDLLGIVAPIGQSFLAAELQRKQSRSAARLSISQAASNGVNPQFPALGAPPAQRRMPGGGIESLAIPSGLTNREFKTAICRAVKDELLHPARATAELKVRGMKGCVRRMNPLNPHALTRAARRMEGFLRVVKRINKAIPTKTRTVRSPGHTHALKSTGVVQGGG